MKPLARRIGALEHETFGGEAMHIIKVNDGQTRDQAISIYEAENGPIEDGPNVLTVIIQP